MIGMRSTGILPLSSFPTSNSTTHHIRSVTMQAIKLARKYPNFSQEQMMQLVDQFKYVFPPPSSLNLGFNGVDGRISRQ